MIESNAAPRIVVAVGDAGVRKLLCETLRLSRKGTRIEECADPSKALSSVNSHGLSLLVLDAGSRPGARIARIRRIRKEGNLIPIVMICLKAPRPARVAGLRPLCVLLKPFDLKEFRAALDAALPLSSLPRLSNPDATAGTSATPRAHPLQPAGLVAARDPLPGEEARVPEGAPKTPLGGNSPRMVPVMDRAKRVAPSEATVLLQGPSGSGKTTLARYIHRLSPRRAGPLVEFSCGDLAEPVVESELFGHEKGAFTGAVSGRRGKFELARGGTVFLDDVGNLSLRVQAKLLRVLQDKVFERVGGEETCGADVRLIAATSEDLGKLVERGVFRKDLYWRLNVVAIALPPLAERREDIPALVHAFVRKFAERESKVGLAVSTPLLETLMGYPWPGNIRELQNTVECMVVLSEGGVLGMEDLPASMRRLLEPRDGNGRSAAKNGGVSRDEVVRALAGTQGRRDPAAKLLGVSHSHFYRLLHRFGLI